MLCCAYLLELHRLGDSNVYSQYIFSWQNKNISLNTPNICFLELTEEFPRDLKNEFESSMVNEQSVFQS